MYEDMKNSKNSQCNDVRDVTFCPPPLFFLEGAACLFGICERDAPDLGIECKVYTYTYMDCHPN